MPVFPWSMSDFKPGDYNETERITAAGFGLLSHRYALRFQMTPLTECLTAFLMQGEETPGRVERKVLKARPSHKFLRRRRKWQSRKKSG